MPAGPCQSPDPISSSPRASGSGRGRGGLGRLGYALCGVIGLIWLALAWMAIRGVPALSPALMVLSNGIGLTLCLLGLLALNHRCRKAQQAGRQASALNSVLSQALSALPIAVHIKDADLRYVWVGAQHERHTGYRAIDMLGRTAEDIDLDPASAAAVTAHDHRVLALAEAGEPQEQFIQGRDGRLKYMSLVTKVPLLRDGKVSHIVTFGAGLQHWQEAEKRAEEIRRLLETVLDAALVTVQVTDRDLRLCWANRAFREHIDWKQGSPVGKTLPEVVPPDGPLPKALEAHRALLEGKQSVIQLNQYHPATDHRPERHLLVTKVAIRDATGAVVQVLTMGTDVTALIHAEAAAETANRLLEGLLRNVPLSIHVKDAGLRYRWANNTFTETVGQDIVSILGKTVNDLAVPVDIQRLVNDMDRKVLESRETLQSHVQLIFNGAASQRMAIKTPILDATGHVTHVITINADVTELHRLKTEVEESRRQLQAVLDAVPVVLSLKDVDRRYVWVNHIFEQTFGFLGDSVIGQRMEDFFADKHLVAKVAKADNTVLMGEPEAHPVLQRYLSPNGKVNDLSVKRHVVRDADGRIDGILVVGMEVTELLRTTVELQRVNEELEHRVAERAGELAKINAFVATMIDRAPVPVVAIDLDGRIKSWNPAATRATGFSAGETLNKLAVTLFPDDHAQISERLGFMRRGIFASNVETRRKGRDGMTSEFLVSSAPMTGDDGTIDGAITIWLDVTEQRVAERQLRHAQKMEALGQLTGNVAHDFNNLLAVVIGNLDLVLETLPAPAPVRDLVNDAIDAAVRGAALTGQLLAFARQQTLRPVIVNLVSLISGIRPLLHRAIGETIAIRYVSDSDSCLVKIDPSQLESAILNLSVNARDAMPTGGVLTIAVRDAALDEMLPLLQGEMSAMDYVCISISDTGTGIAPEILGQVFEPFFTTKSPGKGTGLGLSIVYGFIKQSGGHVHVSSKVGQGTCISLYLPQAVGEVEEDAADGAMVQGHGETILLVEDDPQLHRISMRTLQSLGYEVVAAGNAEQALALLDLHPEIDLLLSDVVLPGGMNGFDLSREACRRKPGLGALFVSGFVDPAWVIEPPDGLVIKVVTKPFRRAELAAELHAALKGQRQPVGTTEKRDGHHPV